MPMTTTAGVGMSRHHNPNVAGREAAEQALKKAGVERPDFVFMFASIGYDQHSVLRAVRDTTGGAPLSGCSVEGTIAAEDADESNFSVVVTAISSDELEWTNGLATGLSADSRAVGQRVAQELLPHLSTDTIGLLASRMGCRLSSIPSLRRTSITSLRDWRGVFQATHSSHYGAGEPATTSMRGRQPISTATNKSSQMGSPTRCSLVRRRLVGP
jgi:hypothetical protein